MRDLMDSLQYVDDFLIYLVLSLALLAAFSWLYDKVTPYDELTLIRNGNTAAAIAYAGAIIGLALPLASAVAHSVNPVDMIIWGVFALAVQVFVYFIVRRLLPQLNDQIPENQCAPAVPEVQMSRLGRPVTRACPSAKKAADRSSTITCTRSSLVVAAAMVSGVERDPGLSTTSVTPAAAAERRKRRAQAR